MAVPSYGAPPLAKAFLMIRGLQMICFIIMIGLTSTFVAEIVASNGVVLSEIVGTLTIVRSSLTSCITSHTYDVKS